MHKDHNIFIQAIKDKKKVLVQHGLGNSTHTEVYRPLFYIPANNHTGCAHYYFWDYKKNQKGNLFKITAKEIMRIGQTHESFEANDWSLVKENGL